MDEVVKGCLGNTILSGTGNGSALACKSKLTKLG